MQTDKLLTYNKNRKRFIVRRGRMSKAWYVIDNWDLTTKIFKTWRDAMDWVWYRRATY